MHLPCWLRQSRICLQCRRPGFDPWVGKISRRMKWLPIWVFLPGEFHGQRTLVGYSPQDCKESDMAEQLSLTHMYIFHIMEFQIRSDQSLSRVRLFAIPWIAALQASLPITNSQSSLRLMSIESVMPSSHLILCRPLLLLPPIPPASESFPMSQLFAWGGQSTGVSVLASFLPKKSQGWSLSECTGWISLQSKGLSRVFSNTTVQKHQFFSAQPSSQSNNNYWNYYSNNGIYSAIKKKKKEILPFATRWMDLEDIMQNEISQTEKDKYCMM